MITLISGKLCKLTLNEPGAVHLFSEESHAGTQVTTKHFTYIQYVQIHVFILKTGLLRVIKCLERLLRRFSDIRVFN